jgi:hypothetical protein
MRADTILKTVWVAMHQQGRPALDRDGNCAYRGDGGTRCAVGVLLTDEEAAAAGRDSVRQLWETGRLPARLRRHKGLLQSLQEAHDGGAMYLLPHQWARLFDERVQRIASQLRVELPPVEWGGGE